MSEGGLSMTVGIHVCVSNQRLKNYWRGREHERRQELPPTVSLNKRGVTGMETGDQMLPLKLPQGVGTG